jgi:hypothetical protein
MLSVADCGIVSAGTYSQVYFKEKIMAMKKPTKKSAPKKTNDPYGSAMYEYNVRARKNRESVGSTKRSMITGEAGVANPGAANVPGLGRTKPPSPSGSTRLTSANKKLAQLNAELARLQKMKRAMGKGGKK